MKSLIFSFCLQLCAMSAQASWIQPLPQARSEWPYLAVEVRASDGTVSVTDWVSTIAPGPVDLNINLIDDGVSGVLQPRRLLVGELSSSMNGLAISGTSTTTKKSMSIAIDSLSVSFLNPVLLERVDGQPSDNRTAHVLSAVGTLYVDGLPPIPFAASQTGVSWFATFPGRGFYLDDRWLHVLRLGSGTLDGVTYDAELDLGWVIDVGGTLVPEPGTASLLSVGLLGLVWSGRRRR